MEWSEAVVILSEFFRVEDWATEIGGVYEVVLDKAIDLKVYKIDNNTIGLNGTVGEPIGDNKQSESVLKKILQWNFGRLKDNNDVVSIDMAQQKLLIIRRLGLKHIDDCEIIHQAESFVSNLSFWADATTTQQIPIQSLQPY
ncbi:MAG: CesT family type III secretion system chaperone [Puniceicoccales bacterium]|jgi:hypothetical protein|nr:CesT family type III secretion system chaperone [Puniceicoccales bacterium]